MNQATAQRVEERQRADVRGDLGGSCDELLKLLQSRANVPPDARSGPGGGGMSELLAQQVARRRAFPRASAGELARVLRIRKKVSLSMDCVITRRVDA